MVRSRPVIVTAALLLGLHAPGNATAQVAPSVSAWPRGTTVNVFAGAARVSSETVPLAGGAVGWELTRWAGIEGSGSWLDQRGGANAFAADLKALVNLVAGHPVVPFVEGGIGLYRASFDPSRGMLPGFYHGRMAGNALGLKRVTFTDPSFIVGGGVNLFVTRHVSIRPDAEAKFVRRDARGQVVIAVNVRLAYHFEDHPITPSRPR